MPYNGLAMHRMKHSGIWGIGVVTYCTLCGGLLKRKFKIMREIKFRAKIKDQWYYGFIMNWAGNCQIWTNESNAHNYVVNDTKTIGQFTGLKDCNGTEIFEGDTLIDLDVELEEGVKLEDTQQQVYWCNKDGAWKLDNTYSQNKKDSWLLAKDLKDFRFKVFGNIYETKSVGEKVL